MLIHAPVVASKTVGPSQVLKFMGIELNSTHMEASLPKDKLQRTLDVLTSFTKPSVHLFELQSLIDTLQYACVRQLFQVEPFCSAWLTLPGGFLVVFTIYGSTRNFLRTSPCGRPFSRSERAFFFPRFYCNFLPRLGTIHGRPHVGWVWGLFY